MAASRFVKSQHPRTEIKADPASFKRILQQAWWGQLKIHGHKAQIHIPSDPKQEILVYTRQGAFHKKVLPAFLGEELRHLFAPKESWTVIEAEWLKSEDRLFLFDFIKRDGNLLNTLSYAERWSLLPRVYSSEYIETLAVLSSVSACLEALEDPRVYVEGLVFKARNTKGFRDSAIVRCRR